MPGGDQRVTARLSGEVLPMFAWADGIASRLADAYRSGMCVNFVLAALAVIIGLAFLPAGLGSSGGSLPRSSCCCWSGSLA